jgi:toxin YoeB
MSNRNITFTTECWRDYQYWLNQDKKTLNKINKLIDESQREPFAGTGKPEPLKDNYAGYWSKRIDKQNRLVYSATETEITIISCRFHYH